MMCDLTLHALKRHNLTNHIHVVRDGAEALDFIFCTGAYAQRNITQPPKVILLDLEIAPGGRAGSAATDQGGSPHTHDPGGDPDLLP